MSIISAIEVDHSATLARRFAALTIGYLDNPAAANKTVAQVPLENLFRLLEMFRYRAFSDEPRRGVLAIGRFGVDARQARVDSDSWYSAIESALQQALNAAFSTTPPDEAIDELQDDLRALASNGAVADAAKAARARQFLSSFQSYLS